MLYTIKYIRVQQVAKIQQTHAGASMSNLHKQARRAVRTVLGIVKDELDDDKRFVVIEQRVIAAPGPKAKTITDDASRTCTWFRYTRRLSLPDPITP